MVSAVTASLSWILLGASLVMGLAALVRMADPAALSAHELTGTVRLAEGLTRAVVALFTMAAIVFLVDLVRRLRSRRRGEGEVALLPEPPKIPAWLRAVTQIVSLAYFVLLAYVLWSRGLPLMAMILSQRGSSGFGTLLPEAVPDAPPLVTWTFGALALAVWVAFSDRLTEWWTEASREEPPSPLAEVVAESVEDLSTEPDARRAIIRCYARFERVAADSGLARRPWLTPMEFLLEALSRLRLPRGAAQTLTGLFELARFSNRAMGEPERVRALQALDEIRAAVPERREHATSRL